MTSVGDRDVKPGNGPKPNAEELADLRKSLEFEATRVGAPGSPVRNRAEVGLWLINFFEGLLKANSTPGNVLYQVLDKVGDKAEGLRLRDPDEIPPVSRSQALALIQNILWREENGIVNEDKEWETEYIEEVAHVLEKFGLGPT